MTKKNRVSTGLPPYAYVFLDTMSFILTVGPGAVGWSAVAFYVHEIWDHPYFFFLCLLSPFVLIAVFLLVLLVFRLLVPKLKRGVYPMGVNKGMLAWYCNLALSRSAEVAGVRPLLNAFYFTKFLHWRALGMKIAYAVNSSIGVSFVDLPLISIGKGSTISDSVHIACHTFVGDRLFVSPVEIGENVFIGMHCILGPKTKIGNNAWIGMHNLVSEAIPEGGKLNNWQWEHGNPARSQTKD